MNEWAFCYVEFVLYDRWWATTDPQARCSVYCDNLCRRLKKETVRTSYVLLNWWLLYLTRPRNNVYIAILYLYKSYF